MKKILNPLFSVCVVLLCTSFQQGDLLCNSKALKEKAQTSLNPFKYDNSELTRIIYTNKETVKEVDVYLFIGEKYRIVFEMESLPKEVEVRIYNKSKDSKNRKLLYSSKDTDAGKTEFQFEVAKARQVYIDYIIPPVETGAYSGCAVFMVGYK